MFTSYLMAHKYIQLQVKWITVATTGQKWISSINTAAISCLANTWVSLISSNKLGIQILMGRIPTIINTDFDWLLMIGMEYLSQSSSILTDRHSNFEISGSDWLDYHAELAPFNLGRLSEASFCLMGWFTTINHNESNPFYQYEQSQQIIIACDLWTL